MRSRSTSETVRPTSARVVVAAASVAIATGSLAERPPITSSRAPSGSRIASGRISFPCESRTARWIVFSSSRTFPFHPCDSSILSVSPLKGRKGTPFASAYLRAKCRARAKISFGRSRRAGSFSLTTFSRYKRSSRKLPRFTASERSRFDVATMRISTLTGLPPPTRSISRSWIARSNFACRRASISEISSKSSVPPFASSNLPTRRAMAPVNAPFSWPKSSDSSRFSGIAAQLTEMNGGHDEVGAAALPQLGQRLLDGIRVRHFGAFLHRDLGRRADLAAEAANDEKPHDAYSCFLSVLDLAGFDDFGHGHAEPVLDQHDFAARDQPVVDVDVDCLADLAVELHHRAAAELQELAYFHRGFAQDRLHRDRHVIDGFKVRRGTPGLGTRGRCALQQGLACP